MAKRAQRRAQHFANKQKDHAPSAGMPGQTIQLRNLSESAGVVVAWIHPVGSVDSRFMNSLLDVWAFEHIGGIAPDEHGNPVQVGGKKHFMGRMPLSSGANIVTARNNIVRQFLA